MEIAHRLKEARIAAGFRSAREAANHFGWPGSTYASHENGGRGVPIEEIRKYAAAFKVSNAFLAFGEQETSRTIGNVPEPVFREVLRIIFQHKGAREAPPEVLADLVLDLCDYARRSGENGLENIVDFSLAKAAAQGR